MVAYRITLRSGWDKAPFILVIEAESKEDAVRQAKEEYHRRHEPKDIRVEKW